MGVEESNKNAGQRFLESSLEEVNSNSIDDDNLFDFLSAVLYLTSLGTGLRDGNCWTLLML
jgi:hypothetical protein